jgi:hypothetical protein
MTLVLTVDCRTWNWLILFSRPVGLVLGAYAAGAKNLQTFAGIIKSGPGDQDA